LQSVMLAPALLPLTETTKENENMIEARMARSSEVEAAVSKVNALRRLTRETGCIARRTQSMILGTLQPDVLTAVAEILAAQPENITLG
jgi:hypothetical protein